MVEGAKHRLGNPTGADAATRVQQALLIAVTAAFTVATFGSTGFVTWRDGWLQGGGYVLCALVGAIRPRVSGDGRRLWALVAAGLALRAAGFILFLAIVRYQEPLPYPSIADAAWLASYLPMAGALVLTTGARLRDVPRLHLLDGISGGAATLALALTALGSVAELGTSGAATTTNTLYPLLDAVLLVIAIAALMTKQWDAPAAQWMLAAGIVGYGVVDSVFLYQVAHGTYRPGTLLSALSLASTALVALAATLRSPGSSRTARAPGVLVPCLLGTACVAFLAMAGYVDVPASSVALAAIGFGTALARIRLTIRTTIAERRVAIRTLRRSERQMSEAQRIAHVGSVELDLPGRALAWSDEMYRVLGLDPSVTPSGDRLVDAVHADDRDVVLRAWREATEQGEPFDLSFRIVRPDGDVRQIRGRGVPQVAEDGSVVSLTATYLDETERVLADELRLASEHRFEAAFEQAEVPAAIAGLDGLPVAVNASMCAFLGRRPDELVGRDSGSYLHPDEPPLGSAVARDLAAGGAVSVERRYVRPDGSVVWGSLRISLVRDRAGAPEFMLCLIEDVTERKSVEAREHAAQQQRIELLQRLARAEDAERHRIARDVHDETIQQMAAAGLRVDSLARGLAARRLERDELERRLVEVGDAVRLATEQVRDLVYNLATPDVSRGVAASLADFGDRIFSETGTAHAVSGDPGPLDDTTALVVYRIVAEALRNARKHAHARRVETHLSRAGATVKVTVTDDGVGLPDGGATVEPGHLGVRTMVERAEAIGGRCTIEPAVNGGTVVTLTLPADPPTADRAHR